MNHQQGVYLEDLYSIPTSTDPLLPQPSPSLSGQTMLWAWSTNT